MEDFDLNAQADKGLEDFYKKAQAGTLTRFEGLLPEIPGRNLALTVLRCHIRSTELFETTERGLLLKKFCETELRDWNTVYLALSQSISAKRFGDSWFYLGAIKPLGPRGLFTIWSHHYFLRFGLQNLVALLDIFRRRWIINLYWR